MSSQLNRDPDTLETKPTLFDRIFRDSEGKIVIAQPPNLPMIVGIVATVLRSVLATGQIHTVFNLIAFGAWFTWAWEETFEGVNYFRRAIGAISLVAIIAIALNLN
ncbi:hypothetical protein [Oscillatoria sp. FACHB-1406]|uniref:hypothetical protein n=1 Tax=Oscillatoria sp. FACHB-1406 TaxID=2692846 RepID=UPI001687F77E|nr:hypothetical protein [Oscillatoria sp. FACHB-1406]MBD2580616.1 hypothetical protein [Oscillatoria sp. FACHB-1406]